MATKPSIVFAHGLWGDGSCFSKLIPTLQAEGHEVIAAQNSLDTLKGDVAAVHRRLRPHRSRRWSRVAEAKWHRMLRGRFARAGTETCLGDPRRARRGPLQPEA